MRLVRLLSLPLAFALFAIALRPAEAKGAPIPPGEFQKLTDWIISPENPAMRAGALNILLASPREDHLRNYDAVVGPVFRDANRTDAMTPEACREMWAIVIAHLVDAEPTGKDLLLVRDYLPLLARDEKLVDDLIARLTPDLQDPDVKPGWRLVLAQAARLLADPDPAVRRAALRVSAYCECVREADTLAALYGALKGSGTTASPEDTEAFLGAAERLLRYRFPNLAALLQFLGAHAERFDRLQAPDVTDTERYRLRADFLADVIDLYRVRGGEGSARARAAALAYGQTVIGKADKPADLLVFFDPERERFDELQRAALQAAAPPHMKPAADMAWASLLIGALRYSDDAAVLDRVVAIIGETFTEPSAPTQQLAEAVAERLRRGAAVDSQPQRLQLASLLGRIGMRITVRKALPDRLGDADAGQKDVLAQLVRDLGLVKDGLVLQLRPYYRSGTTLGPEWARVAVAESLGLPGFRNSPQQGPAAAAMLHHILTGEAVRVWQVVPDPAKPDQFEIHRACGADVATAPEAEDPLLDLPPGDPEPSSAVVVMALASLEFYPGPDAARVLGGFARGERAEAETALKILGRQLARGSADAGAAIAGLLTGDDLPPEKRQLAVLDVVLQAARPAQPATRAALAAAARAVLGASASEAVRRKAAAVAAHLADGQAVKPVYLAWNGLKDGDPNRAPWADLLQQLVVAVAKAGAGGDAALVEDLRSIASDLHRAVVLGLFDAMGAEANRFELKRLRADIRFEYATVSDGRTREDRRKDLDEALRLYRELVNEAPPGVRGDLQRSIYDVLSRRAQTEWLGAGEHPEGLLLEALKAAADSGSKDLARDALEKIGDPLRKSGSLTDAQKSELDQTTKRLQALAGP